MNISKFVFVSLCVLLALTVSFGAGLYNAHHETGLFQIIYRAKQHIDESLSDVAETSVIRPGHFLNRGYRPGSGVTVNLRPGDGHMILMSGFFDDSNEVRLIRRDGSVVHRWTVSYHDLFPNPDFLPQPPATDWNVDTHGALIEPDGSVVFNFEYAGLVKLDRCGRTLWTLRHPTHHSVEKSADGHYWVPGRRFVDEGESEFPPFETPYAEDLILKVSPSGEILSRLSVPALLNKNDLHGLLTATGEKFDYEHHWDKELVHLNKIGELSSDLADRFPLFESGDLVLSIRKLNLVLVFDPRTERVKWSQTGPWLRQHDPEFNPDGTLTIFNNNAFYCTDYGRHAEQVTNILRMDPVTRKTEVVFGQRPGQEMLTIVRGKHDVVPGGGFLITEFKTGRVLQADAQGEIVWEYINRYDDRYVAEISEARLYPPDYFTVSEWNCPDSN